MSSHRCQGSRSTPITVSTNEAADQPSEVFGVSEQPQPHGPGRPVTSGGV
jgi:hypothetical protein